MSGGMQCSLCPHTRSCQERPPRLEADRSPLGLPCSIVRKYPVFSPPPKMAGLMAVDSKPLLVIFVLDVSMWPSFTLYPKHDCFQYLHRLPNSLVGAWSRRLCPNALEALVLNEERLWCWRFWVMQERRQGKMAAEIMKQI